MPTDRYNRTTKEQRKMARLIAADVLKTMRYLSVTRGSYCRVTGPSIAGKDIQSVRAKDLKHCQVCARGAVYVSRARLFDEYMFDSLHFDPSDTVVTETNKDIGKTNAELIESAFEMDPRHGGYSDEACCARDFGALFQYDDRARLRAIMRNVIENKGVFRPPVPKANKVVAK